jgi:hypothetical protein
MEYTYRPVAPEYEKARVINDELRNAALSRRYYGCLLVRTKRIVLTLDVLVAVSTSVAVAAWNLWQAGPGTAVWKVLGGVATLVAVIKPFLNLAKEVERYSDLVSGWTSVYYDLKQINVRMRTSGSIPEEAWSAYEATQQRVKDLGGKEDPRINQSLLKQLFETIKQEIPPETLWWPEAQDDVRQAS